MTKFKNNPLKKGKNMEILLTIGITSYKRIDQLIRCIKSIQTKYVSNIEVLVSEDHSPLSERIQAIVEQMAKELPYRLRFSTNKTNLGYDMNLGMIIKKSQGTYVFLMSDDDELYKGFLDELICFIKENNNYNVLYAPFVYGETNKKDRFHGKNIKIPAGQASAANYLYDSILFSGLIFKKESVSDYDSSKFRNYNYFQVYLFLKTIYKYGGYYFKHPSILCVGDGENAYGLSDSSGGNEILANRKSVKSNLEFNKTLFKVIQIFDEEEDTNVFHQFSKNYSFHSYSGLSIARAEGISYFQEYWVILNNLDIKLYPITKLYYFLLLIFGKRKTDFFLSGFKAIVKKG